jgi:hypothetical protein
MDKTFENSNEVLKFYFYFILKSKKYVENNNYF